MKLETAYKTLVKECEFLGVKFEVLLQDLETAPLSFPLRTIAAYKVYKELAYS